MIAAWPLREALLAFVGRLKRDARDAYDRQLDRYWCGHMKDKPTPPALLADESVHRDG